MNQDPTSPIQPLLDEGIGSSKMLEQILVVDVIHLDDQVLVLGEKSVV